MILVLKSRRKTKVCILCLLLQPETAYVNNFFLHTSFALTPTCLHFAVNLLVEGAYYGHPNMIRATSLNQPRQCRYRAPTEPPDADYTPPLVIAQSSTGAICEFEADHFGYVSDFWVLLYHVLHVKSKQSHFYFCSVTFAVGVKCLYLFVLCRSSHSVACLLFLLACWKGECSAAFC